MRAEYVSVQLVIPCYTSYIIGFGCSRMRSRLRLHVDDLNSFKCLKSHDDEKNERSDESCESQSDSKFAHGTPMNNALDESCSHVIPSHLINFWSSESFICQDYARKKDKVFNAIGMSLGHATDEGTWAIVTGRYKRVRFCFALEDLNRSTHKNNQNV